MAEDASRNIWFGTEDGRLLRVHEKTLLDETSRTLTRGIPIRCLETTSDGSLWIGYAGLGLEWLKDGKFARIGTEQGLPNDFISQIVADGLGGLWCAGNSGIFELRQEEIEQVVSGKLKRVRPVMFGKNEGLPSLQANFGFGLPALRTHDGEICFSMLTGLAVAHPEKVPLNPIPPPVTIEQVRVDGQLISIPGHSQLLADELSPTNVLNLNHPLEISPQYHELRIDFGALSFVSPENLHLKYRLEGYDQKWIETQQRSASYSRMPAGDYHFRVIACNNSGVWNETGAMLQFTVLPFFWQTWWFRLGFVSAFTVCLIAVVYYLSVRRFRQELKRLEQETAVQKDRARIAKDLHDDLGANLSQIAMLSELAQTDLTKPAQAHVHIDQIFRTARLLTRSLDEIVWAVNPRNDSLDGFVVHICQLAPELLRAAGIRPRLDMPMEVPSIKLAPNVRHQLYLALKEALHNVIKHANATEVWVRLKISQNSLTLSVEDNGRGFETSSAPAIGSDGLTNLRHRMEEIGGQFEQQSEPARGTRITFVAPLDGKQI
jgi:signal transduction histidine kinase